MIIGIDPGFTGAVAVYHPGMDKIVTIIDMPLKSREILTGSVKSTIDGHQLLAFMRLHNPSLIVIERVHAMPEQGVSSTFRFGEGFGLVQGLSVSLGCQILMPHASVWKSIMGVSANKATSLAKVRSLFPESQLFGRKKDNGRAEALLLALFGARSFSQVSRDGGDSINDIL